VVLLCGCAIGPSTLRGYYNQPKAPLQDVSVQSGAYLASTHVPWCVSLGRPSLTTENVRAFRTAFYTLSEGEGGVSGDSDPDARRSSCWSLVQQTRTGIDEDAHDREFVALALPGGGSRSAVFSAAVMFELFREGLLQKVDLISSVSGGSLPATLFAGSCNDEAECTALYGNGDALLWTEGSEQKIFDMLTTDFVQRAVMRIALPWNQLLYRTTRYDRTDTMAEVFASSLFTSRSGSEPYGMLFRDLNPRRPNLIINGMNSTGNQLGPGLKGQHFLFTLETFEQNLRSDLHRYPLAFAVVGSAAFPGAFPPLTLAEFPSLGQDRDEQDEPVRYVHIVDGGLYDRLGGEAVRRVVEKVAAREHPCVSAGRTLVGADDGDCLRRASVIVLDSGLPIQGEDTSSPDVRIPVIDLFVNHNLEMASFALLDIQAELRLDSLKAFVRDQNEAVRRKHGVIRDVFELVNVRLRDIERCTDNPLPCARAEGLTLLTHNDARRTYEALWEQVRAVPLSLWISQESAAVLRRAARILVHRTLQDACADGSMQAHCTLKRQVYEARHEVIELYTGTLPP
jgi:predicted acylesterase/phospholipase RssA